MGQIFLCSLDKRENVILRVFFNLSHSLFYKETSCSYKSRDKTGVVNLFWKGTRKRGMGSAGPRNSPFYSSLCDPEIRFVSWLSYFFACIACEYSRVSLLLAARDVSPGGTSSTYPGCQRLSSAVSGFCLVLYSDPPLVASAYGRSCVGLWPTSPAAREKNLWYPGYPRLSDRNSILMT